MPSASAAVALLLRRVLPVVAGEVEPGQVHERVAAVHLLLAQPDTGGALERGQLRLVVRVVEGRAGGRGVRQPGEPGPHIVPGQVLHLAVVLMPSALSHLGDVEIADRAQPGG
jgi:hypothetical protein